MTRTDPQPQRDWLEVQAKGDTYARNPRRFREVLDAGKMVHIGAKP
jgi:hypothetical protein